MGLINLLKKKKNRKILFTTPSHSQGFFLVNKYRQFYRNDISETDTHNPQKALSEAESRASKIYGTKFTKFLTNGSTSGIIAAVLSCVNPNEKVLIWDHAHPCHLNAVKLAGAVPVFYSVPIVEDWGVFGAVETDEIFAKIKENNISALIVTSPSYEGIISDVKKLAKICHDKNIKLIVDEAHGALYPFSDELPETSIGIADFTVQSLHKTAGGLNPTALLHSIKIDPSKALEMINTTSPSYPLLMSIEKNINYLASQRGKRKIKELINQIKDLKQGCNGIEFGGDDITKILVKKDGLTGEKFSEILFDKFNIEDEKTNTISTMLLCGIGTDTSKIKRLKKALIRIGRK